jgi:predicted metal-dependent phosphoesterase TrpH
MFESLHNHTTSSDGTQSHIELLAAAERNNFGIMAFTDHDVVPSRAQLAEIRAYAGSVKWLVGCEISSGLPKELGKGGGTSMHVLGLFVDPTNEAMLAHCQKAQAARSERVERIVRNLVNLGLTISVDDVMTAAAGGDSVGRPHIVRALHAHEDNAAVIEELRLKMEKAAIESSKVAMDFALMMERPPSDFPYRLFLSDDAFIPGVYVDYLYWVDMDTAVNLIRSAGGVAIVAHWYTASKYIDIEMLRGLLKDGRLDGVELMGNPLNSLARKSEPLLREVATSTNSLMTYGIDNHREEEMRGFARNIDLARQTVGQTRQLINRASPDLTYSNLDA